MERRFELRLEELLEDAVLDPRIPRGDAGPLGTVCRALRGLLDEQRAAAACSGVRGRAFLGCEAEELGDDRLLCTTRIGKRCRSSSGNRPGTTVR